MIISSPFPPRGDLKEVHSATKYKRGKMGVGIHGGGEMGRSWNKGGRGGGRVWGYGKKRVEERDGGYIMSKEMI
jgi:hypothetical protein